MTPNLKIILQIVANWPQVIRDAQYPSSTCALVNEARQLLVDENGDALVAL